MLSPPGAKLNLSSGMASAALTNSCSRRLTWPSISAARVGVAGGAEALAVVCANAPTENNIAAHRQSVLRRVIRPPYSLSIAVAILLIAPAGRRNDAVHAQVFHHLAVMIKRMRHGKARDEQLGGLSLPERVGDQCNSN